MHPRFTCWFLLILACLPQAIGQGLTNRYAVILEDPPAVEHAASRSAMRSAEVSSYRAQLETKQQSLRQELRSRHIQVTGASSTLSNAVFVVAGPERVAELKSLPGVKGVVRLRSYRRNLNRATLLVDAPAAWTILGGIQNSGTGIKIGILDTGIDQTNPAFQDGSLQMPAGFPLCSAGDCAFTNNKVIVARSYVRQLAAGSAGDPTADSRPDDYSARDRVGHGTAVASAAAGEVTTAEVTFSGVAPKAYLGSYKIYGSPEVNDFTFDDVMIVALDDAFNDGMDIISLSTGGPAFTGPLDSGAACGEDPGVPCDPLAQAYENAARQGLIIVAAAGNSGEDGNFYPSFGTVNSPADAPSVIAAGATTNSHAFTETLAVLGPGVPAGLQRISMQSGDSFVPPGSWAFPGVSVTQLGDDGFACNALPSGSLVGSIALIQRGPAGNAACTFETKMGNAVDAGAVGVVFYMLDSSAPISFSGAFAFDQPAAMISLNDGEALKNFLASNPGRVIVFQPAAVEQSATADRLASFSSAGPNIGDAALKPDLLAVGTNVFMSAQSYDPLGELFSADGFAVAQGTSFSTPMISGAAALVKQRHPNFNSAQVKSALLNTASQTITTDDGGGAVGIRQVGGGKLDTAAAVNATVTSEPASISFGALGIGTLPKVMPLQITNTGASAVNLTASVTVTTAGAAITLSTHSLALASGASDTLNVTLSGVVPSPGVYSGAVLLQASGISVRIPYLYLVKSGVGANLIPISGAGFDGTVNQQIPDGILAFRLVDSIGLPMAGVPVAFSALDGGTVLNADAVTDSFGLAAAEAFVGSQAGNYSFRGAGGGQQFTFKGYARPQPVIFDGGVVNAASFDSPVAPGSYISIFGSDLSDFTDYPIPSSSLPLAIDFAHVSFDVPSTGLSVPGRLTFASAGQVNVQVPWELQGQTAAQAKVTIDYSYGNVVTVPLADYAPAFFETGTNIAAALDTDFHVINAGNPVAAGQFVQLFVNGLGPVTNQPASGDSALASPLSWTTTTPVVTIGSQPAIVTFNGLAPGFAGLYQINVVIPAGLDPGPQPIIVKIGGATSKASGIALR